MKFPNIISGIALGTFLLSAFLDFLFAFLVMVTKPVFNESNPLYVLTGNFWLLVIVKTIVVVLFYLYFSKWYFKSNHLFRFGMVVLLLIGILGQFAGAYSGYLALQQDPETMQPIPDAEKIKAYQESTAPKAFFIFYAWILFTFWLYMNFNERRVKV